MERSLKELADLVGGELRGDAQVRIRAVNGLRDAGPGEISFLANPKYASLLASTRAAAVIVAPGTDCPVPSIAVPNPDLAFARVAEALHPPPPRPAPGLHPTAVVAPGAVLGSGVSVGAHTVVEEGASLGDGTVLMPQVYVGRGAKIGPGCLLHPQVVVREGCELGARVILNSGVVIGSDGFGFATEQGVHHKISQLGIVVVGDDVEIGANTTVDRARFGRTVIRAGTKIDNLVQIAHNVEIGEGTLIAAQVGISGSTRVGKRVMIGGQSGFVGHIEIGDRAIVTAQSGVGHNVPPGMVVGGHHAVEERTHLKRLAALGKLPEALAELRRLRAELEELRKKIQG